MSPLAEPHECANCQKPAKLRCSGCAPNTSVQTSSTRTSLTWYCMSTCQSAHRSAHKDTCEPLAAEKALYRAGDILQEMFYYYRQHLFDKSIARAEEKNGTIHLHEGTYSQYKTDVDYLCTFPSHLFDSKRDREAVLSFQACSDVTAWFDEITRYVLGGLFFLFLLLTGIHNN